MNQNQYQDRWSFMGELERLLHDIAPSERREALQYYNDYFDDAGVKDEAAVLEALGSPAKVADIIHRELKVEILDDHPSPEDRKVMKYDSDSRDHDVRNDPPTFSSHTDPIRYTDHSANIDPTFHRNDHDKGTNNADPIYGDRDKASDPYDKHDKFVKYDNFDNHDKSDKYNNFDNHDKFDNFSNYDKYGNYDQADHQSNDYDSYSSEKTSTKSNLRDRVKTGFHDLKKDVSSPIIVNLILIAVAITIMPVLLGVFFVVIGLIIELVVAWYGILIAFGATGIILFITGGALLISSALTLTVSPYAGLLLLGAALVCIGVGCLMWLLTLLMGAKVTPLLNKGCKFIFRKGKEIIHYCFCFITGKRPTEGSNHA
ncbi:MAG: hypothetical protein LBM69_06115 [Lachnospiraceae bacterium]|jgi:uncharacterized membrane protein|nr:hypothetical protein [Lachnospiraceae bacterium]